MPALIHRETVHTFSGKPTRSGDAGRPKVLLGGCAPGAGENAPACAPSSAVAKLGRRRGGSGNSGGLGGNGWGIGEKSPSGKPLAPPPRAASEHPGRKARGGCRSGSGAIRPAATAPFQTERRACTGPG